MTDANIDTETRVQRATRYNNPGRANDLYDELEESLEAEWEKAISDAETAETRSHVEKTNDPDLGTISLNGDEIPLEQAITAEVGFGHIARLERVDPSGFSDAQVDALIAVLDGLNAVTSDEYGRAYWDALEAEEIGIAFRQALMQSRGGEQAGK